MKKQDFLLQIVPLTPNSLALIAEQTTAEAAAVLAVPVTPQLECAIVGNTTWARNVVAKKHATSSTFLVGEMELVMTFRGNAAAIHPGMAPAVTHNGYALRSTANARTMGFVTC